MTYKEFQGSVIGTLGKRLPQDTSFQIHRIIKTNDRELDGLVISEPGSLISPTIYLNPLFDAFKNGSSSFEEVIDTIFDAYTRHRNAEPFDTGSFIDFERAKSHIVIRLLNRKKNERLLSDVPFMPYLDLAVIFAFLTEVRGEGLGAIVIHNSHMEEWGKKKEELYETAITNNERLLHPTLTPMKEILMGIGIFEENEPADYDRVPLYVLSNDRKNYGAATILYKGQLKKAAKVLGEKELCLIPSSVHEILIMPKKDIKSREEIDRMVLEVNTTTLSPDEVLSDHAYYYDAADDRILY